MCAADNPRSPTSTLHTLSCSSVRAVLVSLFRLMSGCSHPLWLFKIPDGVTYNVYGGAWRLPPARLLTSLVDWGLWDRFIVGGHM